MIPPLIFPINICTVELFQQGKRYSGPHKCRKMCAKRKKRSWGYHDQLLSYDFRVVYVTHPMSLRDPQFIWKA